MLEKDSAPVLDGPSLSTANESLSKIDETSLTSQEKDTAALPANQSNVVLHLPYISLKDDTIMECLSPEAQGLGSSIAGSFDVSTEAVMGWYCSGYAFEDILLALQTTAEVDVSADEVLDRLGQGQTWEVIWVDIGLLE